MHKINFHQHTYNIEDINKPVTQFEDLVVYEHKMVLNEKYRPYDDYVGKEDVFEDENSPEDEDEYIESENSELQYEEISF